MNIYYVIGDLLRNSGHSPASFIVPLSDNEVSDQNMKNLQHYVSMRVAKRKNGVKEKVT